MAAKVPGYSAIGLQAKETLSGAREGIYQYDKKATVASKTANGVELASTIVSKESGSTEHSIKATYRERGASFTGVVQDSGKVALTAGYSSLTPGLLLSLTGTYPNLQTTSKFNIDYTLPHATLKSTVSLEAQPNLDAALTFGQNNLWGGVDLSFVSSDNSLAKYNLGFGWTNKDFQVGVQLLDQLQTVKAVYAHVVEPSLVVAAEATHPLREAGKTSIVFGVQKRLEDGLLAKIKVDDNSIVQAHLEGLIHPRVVGGLSVQFNAKDSAQAPRWGFAASTSL